MSEVSSLFKKTVNSSLRNKGTLHYSLCLDDTFSSYMYTYYEHFLNSSSSTTVADLSTSVVLDRCLLKTNIAILDEGGWLLDGSYRSVNTKDIVYSETSSDREVHTAVSEILSNDQGVFEYFQPKVSLRAYSGDPNNNEVNYTLFKWDSSREYNVFGWRYPYVDKIQIAWDLVSKQLGACNVDVWYLDEADIIKMDVDRLSGTVSRYVYARVDSIESSSMTIDNERAITTVDLGQKRYIVGVDITVNSWSEKQSRAIITEVLFDDFINDDNEIFNITNVEISKSIDVFNNDNPQYTCNLELDNSELKLDPLGRSGLISKLTKGLPLYMQFGIMADSDLNDRSLEVLGSVECWYLLSYKVSEDTYTVTLKLGSDLDLIENVTTYHRDAYNMTNAYSSLGVINEMCTDGVPTSYKYIYTPQSYFRYDFAYKYPTYMQNSMDLTAPVSPDDENMDVTKQAALLTAGGCVCLVDSGVGSLVLHSLKDTLDSSKWLTAALSRECILSAPQIKEVTQSSNYSITYKQLNYHHTMADTSVFRYDWTIVPGAYRNEVLDLNEVFGSSLKESTLIGSDAGEIYTPTDPADVFFMDDTYIPNLHTTAVVRRGRYFSVMFNNTTSSDVTVSSTLRVFGFYTDQRFEHVSDENASTSEIKCSMCGSYAQSSLISSNYESMRKLKQTIEFEYTGNPSIEPGDYLQASTDYGDCLILVLETSLTYNGSFSGKLKGYVCNGLDN